MTGAIAARNSVFVRTILASLAMLSLGACADLTKQVSTSPTFDIDKDIADAKQLYGDSVLVKGAFAEDQKQTDEAGHRRVRDEFITGRRMLIDLQYKKLSKQLYVGRAAFDSGMDLTKIGVDLATTVTGTAETKSILGAVSTGLTGSRLSIEKNFFEEKTTMALISQMNAERSKALLPILSGLKLDTAQYSLGQAVNDLQDYDAAGQIENALASLEAQAVKAKIDADAQLSLVRQSDFADDAATQSLLGWLYPGYVTTVNGARLDKDGKPITVVSANLDALRKWKAADAETKDIGMGDLLDSAAYAGARKRAVQELMSGKK